MCGIIGYVGPRPAGPHPDGGTETARVPRLRLGRAGGPVPRGCPGRRETARQDLRTGRFPQRPAPIRSLRDRAHPLGHARSPDPGQRPPAPVALAGHRAGSQRDHRERGPPAALAARHGVRVPLPDRHRGAGPPHRPRVPRHGPPRGRGGGRAGPRRGDVRHRGGEFARPRQDRGRTQRQPPFCSGSVPRTSTSSPQTRPPSSPIPSAWCGFATATRPS